MDPKNATALHELELVHNLMHFDKVLPTDATLKIERSIQNLEFTLGEDEDQDTTSKNRA